MEEFGLAREPAGSARAEESTRHLHRRRAAGCAPQPRRVWRSGESGREGLERSCVACSEAYQRTTVQNLTRISQHGCPRAVYVQARIPAPARSGRSRHGGHRPGNGRFDQPGTSGESRRIAQDFYDDLDASYGTLMDQKGILFKSNRVRDSLKTMPVDSILPVAPFNLYFLPFETDKLATSKKAIRLTENYYYDIDQPSISGRNQITFLYDENGVKQRKSITIDNAGTQIATSSSHLDHDFVTYHAADDKGVGVIQRGRKIDLVRDGVNTKDTIDWSPTSFRKLQIKTNKIPDILSTETFPVPPPAKTEPNEEKPVVLFQSEFPDFESKDDKKQSMHPDKREEPVSDPIQYDPIVSRFNPVEIEAPEKFSFIRMIASRLKFKLHETVSTMDNSLLFGGLNSYAGQKMGFEYPPAGFLLKAKIKDLFEDYAIEGGVRIPTNFNGTEYFMIFDNNKRRIDKRFAIYRQTRYTTEELSAVFAQRYRNRTMIALAQFRYPFDTYQSFRLSGTLRFDRSVLLATAPTNLDITPITNQRVGIKGE